MRQDYSGTSKAPRGLRGEPIHPAALVIPKRVSAEESAVLGGMTTLMKLIREDPRKSVAAFRKPP
jgi:hypothetical protein